MTIRESIVKAVNRYPRIAQLRSLRALSRAGFLAESGWFDSFRTFSAIDGQGVELPWYTYPAIRFLAERVRSDMTVFEYGSGNSTVWWGHRVCRVVSCEHESQWHAVVSPRLPAHVEYHLLALDSSNAYVEHIGNYRSEFDIVVIDGRQRVRCSLHTLPALTPAGVVVWDNSDRREYQEGFDHLTRSGFKRLDFWGMGPINTYEWCTSIFYRQENCLAL